MKILHTSDWHIGKRVGEYSLQEEQRHALDQIVAIAREEQPDVIVIAGDVYDRSIPSAEAMMLLDDVLVALATPPSREAKQPEVLIIAGNHDSAERLAYGARLLRRSHIHLSPVYQGEIVPVEIGGVAFYMLPYMKAAEVPSVIEQMEIERSRRNILVAHQFITDAERTDSEEQVIGGLDNIDAACFEGFDYVALGHLHRAQNCGKETIRYSGTPMKYSFSEVHDRKSVTIIEVPEAGGVTVRERAIVPLHDWYDLRGTYDELTAREFYQDKGYQEGFVRVTLTDEEDIPNGQRKLKAIYHRLVELRYDNTRTRQGLSRVGSTLEVQRKQPIELLGELYQRQNGQSMSEEQQAYARQIIEKVFAL